MDFETENTPPKCFEPRIERHVEAPCLSSYVQSLVYITSLLAVGKQQQTQQNGLNLRYYANMHIY